MFQRASISFLLLASGVAACQSPTEKQASTASTSEVPAAPQPADTLKQPIVSAENRPSTVPPASQIPQVVSAKNYSYTVPPVNQIPQEPALQAFVQKILRACAARRAKDLLALVDDSVMVSYGGGIYGKPGFITDFLNSSHPGSGFGRLQQVIRLGGTVSHDSAGLLFATFPYLQDDALYKGQLATVELDPYISYVGLVPGLVVYRRPTRRSQRIIQLNYPVLLTSYNEAGRGGNWLRVFAVDSIFQGYAENKYLYCLADITLTIEQKKGQFKITSVVPYD